MPNYEGRPILQTSNTEYTANETMICSNISSRAFHL